MRIYPAVPTNRQGGEGTRGCFNCRRPRHWSRDCREPRRNRQATQSGWTRTPGTQDNQPRGPSQYESTSQEIERQSGSIMTKGQTPENIQQLVMAQVGQILQTTLGRRLEQLEASQDINMHTMRQITSTMAKQEKERADIRRIVQATRAEVQARARSHQKDMQDIKNMLYELMGRQQNEQSTATQQEDGQEN